MSTNAADVLVIMLHGVGSSGSGLAPLANAWKTVLPGAALLPPTHLPLPASVRATSGSALPE